MADAEDLSQFGDASFDVVTCNCGLMFMPNYERWVDVSGQRLHLDSEIFLLCATSNLHWDITLTTMWM